MVKKEYVSPEGYRLDGRRVNETRAIKCTIGGISKNAEGSAYFEIGNTKVIAVVFGPWESSKKKGREQMGQSKGTINCKFVMAPFSTQDRRRRRGGERQAIAHGLAMRQTFESLVVTSQFSRSQVDIYAHVLEADGGELCAAINAATLALMDAGVPMRDIPAACCASVIGKNVLADPSQEEVPGSSATMTMVVQASDGKVILNELDAKIAADLYAPLSESCHVGAIAIAEKLKSDVVSYIENSLLRNPELVTSNIGSS
eukprot:GDKJ01051333.1.p1 GENE.GDKJ01051333.1~~GDKJ01051333.1.p1  ORF type:complete len:258 (-),score=41.77 GDKJ01051333.1:49-822(-)